MSTWGCGSVGRALASHVRGQGFESPHLHQKMNVQFARIVRSFFGLEIVGFEPLGLGASRRIPSSPPAGKPDNIKGSIVKSGFLLFLRLKNLLLNTDRQKPALQPKMA